MLYQLSHVRMPARAGLVHPRLGRGCVKNCSRSWRASKLAPAVCRPASGDSGPDDTGQPASAPRPGFNRRICGPGGPRLGIVDVDRFVRDGYVVIRGAVGAETVRACQELIWEPIARRGVRRDDPATWPPLVGSDDLGAGPFAAAGASPPLAAACDQLIGAGRWISPVDVGNSVVVRFPSEDRANAGYHIEGSYPGPDGQDGWVNIRSRARGLLALFLFTDVGPDDAPTRLMCGSHLAVPEFSRPTVRKAPARMPTSGVPLRCAFPLPTRPARPGTCSCATRSSFTPRPGRTAARRRG
jgi:hypothetical protein